MSKPIVLIAEELSPATIDALGPDFEVRNVDGASREALLPALADVDAVLIRSATKMDAEAIAAAKNLKVIARAGVGPRQRRRPRRDPGRRHGRQRPDLQHHLAPPSSPSASCSPTARNIAPANQALKAGAWKRSKYGGVELLDKKVGVVGFGRIGQLVAERLKGFGVEILAYDPYVSAQRAGQLGAQLVTLDELLEQSDFITVHLPKSPETLGLIGKEALTKVKPTVRIINAARGGIVDEEALAEALREGRVAGAGIDVFAKEPTTESPLFEFESVVVTPHLGASTDEAQEKAGVAVAKSVRLALGGDLVPDAVNVSGGAVPEEVRPGIALVEKLGRIFTSLAGSVPVQLDVDVKGEITAHDVSIWKLAALKGLFTDVTEDPVTYVNAPLLAEQRGCEVRLLTDPSTQDFRNVTTLHGTLADGTIGQRLGHPHRSAPHREDRRGQRLRHRGAAHRAPRLLHLRRPPRRHRHGRSPARRRAGQHRRHAGRPQREGRPGARRPHRRQRDPGRRARGDRLRGGRRGQRGRPRRLTRRATRCR